MVGLLREEDTRRLSKAEVRGLTRHRPTGMTGAGPGRPTTPASTRTPTAGPRRAGGTLPPRQEVTEARSTGPVVRREK